MTRKTDTPSGTTEPLPLTLSEIAVRSTSMIPGAAVADRPEIKRRSKGRYVHPVERRRRIYAERNANLRALGFRSYSAYTKSGLWEWIRSRVLAAHPSCRACGARASQVHHLAYRKKDLEGRDLSRLVALCGPCHRRIEFRDSDGEKLNTAQANAKLRQITRKS